MSPQRISDERLAARIQSVEQALENHDYLCEVGEYQLYETDIDLRDTRAALVEAREALRRVDEIENSEAVREVYTVAHVHGVIYRGPTWRKEVDAALARIEAVLGEGK